jgi:hypothetical protein
MSEKSTNFSSTIGAVVSCLLSWLVPLFICVNQCYGFEDFDLSLAITQKFVSVYGHSLEKYVDNILKFKPYDIEKNRMASQFLVCQKM